MSNTDSRLVERHGFKVDVVSPQGMSLHDKEQNDLSESVDSHQAALDLAAAMPHVEFDLFLTFTRNISCLDAPRQILRTKRPLGRRHPNIADFDTCAAPAVH
jgi:hypothetical protein